MPPRKQSVRGNRSDKFPVTPQGQPRNADGRFRTIKRSETTPPPPPLKSSRESLEKLGAKSPPGSLLRETADLGKQVEELLAGKSKDTPTPTSAASNPSPVMGAPLKYHFGSPTLTASGLSPDDAAFYGSHFSATPDTLHGEEKHNPRGDYESEGRMLDFTPATAKLNAEIDPESKTPSSGPRALPSPGWKIFEEEEEDKRVVPTHRTELSDEHGENPTPVNEDLEVLDRAPDDRMIDIIAKGTARGLAGVQSKPIQAAVSGYLGSRNLNNEDIQGSAATGTNKREEKGYPHPVATRFADGDTIATAKESHNTATDTLRPTFGIAPANGVVPTKRQQVESDLLFNDFSVVAPGHGLGVTNKMFLMEERRDEKIVYREPLAEPRKYDGPTDGAIPPPLKWQNEIPRRDRNTLAAQAIGLEAAGVLLESRAGAGSLNILGDDFGMPQRISDKGLKRQAESPLEPMVRLPKAWERVKALPGVQWARKQTRRLFDSQRYPERFEPNIAQEGGPIMGKRNALAVFPFPLTT